MRLRLVLYAASAGIVLAVLFTVVFPWVSRTLVDDPTMDPPPVESGG